MPQKLLQEWNGFLTTDGYNGYNNLGSKIKRTGCWAHVHRKFVVAAQEFKHLGLAAKFDQLIDQLYQIEDRIADLPRDKRLQVRKTQSRKIVEQFWELTGKYPIINKSKLKNAVEYALKNREALEAFLNDPMIPLDNNLVERSIKKSVICRKNSLFSTSVAGVTANAIFLSLAGTANLNHLNFQKYLEYLFFELPKFCGNPREEQLEDYLPWSKEVQAKCRY
ncbi:hypothetical protein XA3_06710 [Xylocopilactobacillus apicola]|uniref:Transposase IS66 central domain-containing protein n=1 Tax=Xylocopilactobacillus apicola TaxID=2932184 RepID=A0AAU9DED9_9LACO|nr:hypothetical protein XA3_06710 [Xylocopilactobacillus apicola]